MKIIGVDEQRYGLWALETASFKTSYNLIPKSHTSASMSLLLTFHVIFSMHDLDTLLMTSHLFYIEISYVHASDNKGYIVCQLAEEKHISFPIGHFHSNDPL